MSGSLKSLKSQETHHDMVNKIYEFLWNLPYIRLFDDSYDVIEKSEIIGVIPDN